MRNSPTPNGQCSGRSQTESSRRIPAGEAIPRRLAYTTLACHSRRRMSRRLFLSCASREFPHVRGQLTADLQRPGVDIKAHEEVANFNSGLTTLEKLDDYIRGCEAVVHLIGQA